MREDRVEEALEVSRLLVWRFEHGAAETVEFAAEIVVQHLMDLVHIGGPTAKEVAGSILTGLANGSIEAVRAVGAWLKLEQSPASAGVSAIMNTVQPITLRVIPRSLIRSRRRLDQALASSRTVIDRIGASAEPELQRLAATARFAQAAALVTRGHIVLGSRAFDSIARADESGGIQALQQLAAQMRQSQSTVDQLGAIGLLAMRAQTLGGEDATIARIAYDDSLQEQPSDSQNLIVRLMAWVLRPHTTRKSSK